MNRPKMPKIESLRERKFTEQIQHLRLLPNKKLTERIDAKIFSMDANRLFYYRPHILAGDEYKRCVDVFERRIPEVRGMSSSMAQATAGEKMHNLMASIFVKEENHQEELKQIAVDVVRELFDIPDHVQILPDMTPSLDMLDVNEQDDSPQPFLSLTEEDKREMRDEIQKRIILNGLVHGSAMHIWKTAHYIVQERISELDPFLMALYDAYTASVGWFIWQMSPEESMNNISKESKTQGSNSLEFEEPGEPWCNIRCHGINFPVLLHEVTKGAMDYLICHGIPQDYSEEQLQYYYAKADAYENEYWHYLMSPTIWIKLSEAADVTTQEIPLVIARLTQLSYRELCDVLEACIDSKDLGNKKLQQKNII